MTNPAESFKKKLKEKEEATQKRWEELRSHRENFFKEQQGKIGTYQKYLSPLIEVLEEWAVSGGLACQNLSVAYYDFETLYQTKGVIVSDGNKKVSFQPAGVSSNNDFKGTVKIEMPKSLGSHVFFLGLDSNPIEEEPFWVFVDYDKDNPSNSQTARLTDDVFFQLMSDAFLE
ncbi:hypothetical protein [Enterobacter kobei]|uniref:hypothetical protein n=1 Tax=Enterobacter kobei TaxID=208224 RepID=UPI00079882ED|nr:hypothetical protein [Enterobacter kobei]SAE60024.1 Uncharacterised protein [Enterobacter kobei]